MWLLINLKLQIDTPSNMDSQYFLYECLERILYTYDQP